jgi:hypothetical protein
MRRLWIFAAAGIALQGVASGQQPGEVRPKEPRELDVRAEETRQAQAPAGVEQVAVLSISLDVVDGVVRSARVTSAKRIASFAPKVFARRGGEWEVIIEGGKRHSFFVNNPARREAEAHPSSNDQYEWVGETGAINWPLVVPLYVDGRAIGARSITIRDTRTGATILQTDI